MPHIKFKKINKGYIDPKNGKAIDNLDGRLNRPGIDEFVHIGYINTKQKGRGKTIKETEFEIIIEMDITDQKVEAIIDAEPELEPRKLTDEEINDLKPKEAESGVTS